MKEFHQNVAKITDATSERLLIDVQQGLDDAKHGSVYTQDEIKDLLGL